MSSTVNIWKLTMTAMLSAIAFVLMLLEFSIPVMPPFIKMDVSELPALLGAFSMGPVSGVMICLIKNLLHLLMSTTGGVGELSNFLLGACFVLPAGILYQQKKSKKRAIFGAAFGSLLMALASIGSNYYVVYPFYYNFMSEEAVLQAYQLIVPGVKNILECLVIFNAPFTLVKGLICVIATMFIYKPLSPFLKGNYRNR